MVTVRVFLADFGISGFTAKGHTGYADRGEDLVCAAVSAITQTAIFGLCDVVGVPVKVERRDGYLRCFLPRDVERDRIRDSQIVLGTLRKGLEAISQEYGDYICIEEVK